MSVMLPRAQLWTVQEVAERLRVSLPMVWKLIYSGELGSVKVGRVRRVSEAQLSEYVQRLEAAR